MIEHLLGRRIGLKKVGRSSKHQPEAPGQQKSRLWRLFLLVSYSIPVFLLVSVRKFQSELDITVRDSIQIKSLGSIAICVQPYIVPITQMFGQK